MKCQILFSGKNKINISICHLLKILPRVLNIKEYSLQTCNPLFCRALTEIFLASPILGVMGTLNGDSGIWSSLNLIETKYSPVIANYLYLGILALRELGRFSTR